MTATDLETRYFKWLYHHIGSLKDPNPSHGHWLLAEQLHKTTFNWFVPNDDNRSSDGLSLRDDFCDEVGSWGPGRHIHDPCSMLEMLIALAKRTDYEADDLGMGEGIGEWFWTLMTNVGLRKFTDEVYLRGRQETELHVQEILNNLIERKYEADGRGGLFPLSHPQRDQRTVELWYQMSDYLLENSNI